jgi:hypothetical protein
VFATGLSIVLVSLVLLTEGDYTPVPERRDALAARIGASLSTADKVARGFSELICGDFVESVCMTRAVWRAGFDVVDLEGTLWQFDVDGGGGEVRLRDVCVAGIGKCNFLAGTGERFDNELLVIRDDMDGRESLAVRRV